MAQDDQGTPDHETADERYFFSLMTPANNSGAGGVAFLTLDSEDHTLTVEAAGLGLEPNREHPFHIHGFTDDRPSELPTIDQDTDLDGFVETPEGEPVFGPVLLPLTQDDEENDDRHGGHGGGNTDFPTANAQGEIEFSETYEFDLDDPEQAAVFSELTDRLEGRGIQFHGLVVPDGEGDDSEYEVSGEGGYIAELPVANGIIEELPAGLTPDLLDTLGITPMDVADFLFV
jgi:hypothetical protein